MLARVCLTIAVLVALSAWSRSGKAQEAGASAANDTQMVVSPVVSGMAYPNEVGAETRSNYLSGGLSFSAGYLDNLYGGSGTTPMNDTTYLIQPTISLDQTTARVHENLNYTPAFTFYQPTSGLDEFDQSAALEFQFRLSPHVSLRAADKFNRSSNAFNQPFSQQSVSGSLPPTTPGIVVPFAERLTNDVETQVSWQFARSGMIGSGATESEMHYPNASQSPGLYDSNSYGASAFYNDRLSEKQYLGVTYLYSRSTQEALGVENEVQVDSVLVFYTVYLTPTFTFSVTSGPQYYEISESPLPVSSSVTPAASASVAWQTLHTNLAGSFNRTVSAGSGLVGAFQSESVAINAGWQLARTWTVGFGGNYSSNKTVASSLTPSTPGGHTLTATASLEHPLGEHFNLAVTYARMHQSYPGVAAISGDPDTDRALVSVLYRFSRPLGR